jgi:hypothetical protein
VAGLLYGAWVDGTGWLTLGAGMAASLAITGAIYQLSRYQRKQIAS